MTDELDAMPNAPVLTPDVLAKNDAEQKALRSVLPFDTSVNSRTLARSNAVVKELETIPIADQSPRQKLHFAESLAALGYFAKAYEVSGDERYLEYKNAFENKECKCADPESFEIVNDVPVKKTHSRLYKKRGLYADGKWHSLMCCNFCQNLTIRDA